MTAKVICTFEVKEHKKRYAKMADDEKDIRRQWGNQNNTIVLLFLFSNVVIMNHSLSFYAVLQQMGCLDSGGHG